MYLRVRDGAVTVTANARIPKKTVDLFVQKNAGYIRRRLAVQEQTRVSEAFGDGMKIRLLGEERTLRLRQGKAFSADFSADPVWMTVRDPEDAENNEKQYKKALRSYTEALLSEICREYYPFFEPYGVAFPKVSFRRMTSRWGSCRPAKQAITLNTALIEAPREAIEYIVVHEFAHFLHADHSARFYEEVTRVMPDWKARKKRLVRS